MTTPKAPTISVSELNLRLALSNLNGYPESQSYLSDLIQRMRSRISELEQSREAELEEVAREAFHSGTCCSQRIDGTFDTYWQQRKEQA